MGAVTTTALHDVLNSLRLPNGAYIASPSRYYSHVWIRDVVYTVLPYLHSRNDRYERAFHALLNMFRHYEWKLDIHTHKRPVYPFEYIHARYDQDLQELAEPWGHAQNDAIGLFLWGVAEGIKHGHRIFRDDRDRGIIQKLVLYLACLEYWQLPDNGMWEASIELHASSVGACVAGLRAIQSLVDVDEQLIRCGELSLKALLPRESKAKETDLALLSLIYPFHVVSYTMAKQILNDAAGKLERSRGCIRYIGDDYYKRQQEAEWCFGLPWLGLCHLALAERQQAEEYWEKTSRIVLENGVVPELFFGGSNEPNENKPLAWAVALVLLFHDQLFLESSNPAPDP
ncbi:MAG TPA: glycoside hydrolase family 15 protein [Desulfobacteria bacterium]|nr:glycoside hydrolase family 15 protein [Desulfobacteria bacterium]